MRTPISYALEWPQRDISPTEKLDLAKIGQLNFQAPDEARFPALRLAREALSYGGSAGCILNGSKEVAVDAFIAGHIKFTQMAEIVEKTFTNIINSSITLPFGNNIKDIMTIDNEARRIAAELIKEQ